ncbi:MAG: formate dehydrogenase subunit delta [Stellaceae bacterium]
MSPEKLTYMANQIAIFFHHRAEPQAVADTLDHLKKFWDPRMRRDIVAHLKAGGAGFDPIVRQAVAQLAADTTNPHLDAAAAQGEK